MTIINDMYAIASNGIISNPDLPDVGNVTEDDTVNGVAGTYHEATTAEVQSGVTFGADEELTGTYSAGANDVSIIDVGVDLV